MLNSLPDAAFMMTNLGLSREVQYIELNIKDQNAKKAGSDIANLSMGIQKGRYDGSDEAYQRLLKGLDEPFHK